MVMKYREEKINHIKWLMSEHSVSVDGMTSGTSRALMKQDFAEAAEAILDALEKWDD